MITRAEFSKAKRIVNSKLFLMSAEQRINYAFQTTTGLHELRHVHDYFGTTAGFFRLHQLLRDGIAFNRMWDELRRGGRIKIPLARWEKSPDAPGALRDYLAKRRLYIESLHLFDGTTRSFPEGNGESGDADAVFTYVLKGLGTIIVPAVSLNVIRIRDRAVGRRLVPLGARAVLEGTAFATLVLLS